MELISSHRLPAAAKIPAVQTAIIAIHWQRELADPAHTFGSMFAAEMSRRALVPRMAGLLEFARKCGVLVVFANVVFDPSPSPGTPNPLARLAAERGSFLRGSVGASIIDELGPKAGDLVCEHHVAGIFYDSNLNELLSERGVKCVAVAGMATNVAVDSTIREATTFGFRTLLIEDCCCSFEQKYHDAAMLTLRLLSSDVISADEFKELITP